MLDVGDVGGEYFGAFGVCRDLINAARHGFKFSDIKSINYVRPRFLTCLLYLRSWREVKCKKAYTDCIPDTKRWCVFTNGEGWF